MGDPIFCHAVYGNIPEEEINFLFLFLAEMKTGTKAKAKG